MEVIMSTDEQKVPKLNLKFNKECWVEKNFNRIAKPSNGDDSEVSGIYFVYSCIYDKINRICTVTRVIYIRKIKKTESEI